MTPVCRLHPEARFGHRQFLKYVEYEVTIEAPNGLRTVYRVGIDTEKAALSGPPQIEILTPG